MIVYRDVTRQLVLVVKNPPANRGDEVRTPWVAPGGGHSHALQYCCLETPGGQRALRAAVPRVAVGRD